MIPQFLYMTDMWEFEFTHGFSFHPNVLTCVYSQCNIQQPFKKELIPLHSLLPLDFTISIGCHLVQFGDIEHPEY